jgi:hypothetical protein
MERATANRAVSLEDRGVVNLTQEFAMGTDSINPLRQRMIEDMAARKLGTMRSEATSTAAGGSPLSWGDRPTRRRPTTFAASSCTWSRAG